MNWPIRCLQFKTMVATLFAFFYNNYKIPGMSQEFRSLVEALW